MPNVAGATPAEALGPGDPLPLVLTARGWAALGRRPPVAPAPNDVAGARYELTAAGRAALGAAE